MVQEREPAHRAHLHSQLKEMALARKREKQSIKLLTLSEVVFIDADTTIIKVAGDSPHRADVLLGANPSAV